MGNGFAGLVPGDPGLRLGYDALSQLVAAQLQPLPPDALRRAGPAFDEGHIRPRHGVRLELFDQVAARFGVHRHAKDAAGVLVKAMNWQGPQPAIYRWQRPLRHPAVPDLKLALQEIGQDAQRREFLVRSRH
jgi:hypothetical protein